MFCYSKHNNTDDSITFFRELIAMKSCMGFFFYPIKIGIFGITVHLPSGVFCDNQTVVKNYKGSDSAKINKHGYLVYYEVW